MAGKTLASLFKKGARWGKAALDPQSPAPIEVQLAAIESDPDLDAVSRANLLAAEALAEAGRLNDLYVAAAAEAHAARSEATVFRDQLEKSQEFGARAYSEAQRINALLLDAQAEANDLRGRAISAEPDSHASDAELNEVRQLLQEKIRESQERFDYAQVAWKEAARINDLYVEAARRAVIAEQDAVALKRRLDAQIVGTAGSSPAPKTPVSEKATIGPIMRGSWAIDMEFDNDLKALSDFVALHRPRPDRPDIAVLLMFPGWEKELRGNRWHVAKFLSSIMPVILVQPAQLYSRGGPHLVPERRLKNTWILETLIHQAHWPDECDEAFLHSRDIEWAVRRLGGTSPLYWLFSPYLAKAFTGLPDGRKLVHATEDWVDFPGLAPWAKTNFNEALAVADLVVAVSDGVARNISDRVDQDRLITVANGCDFDAYSNPAVHRTFEHLRRSWSRIAIFAGNIDYRIDFNLLKQAAESYGDTLFALIGPVRSLDNEDSEIWRAIQKLNNVRWFGPFDPDVLPSVYAGADIGIIPYKQMDFIVRSNFSLKLLEMAAANLPVVTTAMDSVRGLASALIVSDNAKSFLAALGRTSRSSLTSAAAEELRKVAAENDYTKKFESILAELGARRPRARSSTDPNWSSFAQQITLWRSSLISLATGETAKARAGLLNNARSLRARLGRHHPTAQKALIDLAKSFVGRPFAQMRFLSAAIKDGTRNLGESPVFRGAAIAHCSTAVSTQQYDAAVWSGRRAWESYRSTLGDQSAPAELLLNLLTALVEIQASPKDLEPVLQDVINERDADAATRAQVREVVERYLARQIVAKEKRREILHSLDILAQAKP